MHASRFACLDSDPAKMSVSANLKIFISLGSMFKLS